MKTQKLTSLIIQAIFLLPLFLFSCQDDAEKPGTDPKKQEQTQKALAFRKEFDFVNRFMSTIPVELPSGDGGRRSYEKNVVGRIREIAPCVEPVEEELPDGSFKVTMDFGDGCSTEEEIVLAGKIVMIMTFDESVIEFSMDFIDYQEIHPNEEETSVINGVSGGAFTIDPETFMFGMEISQDLDITYSGNKHATFTYTQKSESTETGLLVTEFNSSGQFANGDTFTTTVTQSLVFDFSCNEGIPVRGVEVLIFNGNRTEIDYGNGACDEAYVVK